MPIRGPDPTPIDKVEVVKQLNIHELTGDGMKPGEVKQHS